MATDEENDTRRTERSSQFRWKAALFGLLAATLVLVTLLAGRPPGPESLTALPTPAPTFTACATTVTSLDPFLKGAILYVLRDRLSRDARAPGASVESLAHGCFLLRVPATPAGRDAAMAAIDPGVLALTDGGKVSLPTGTTVALSCTHPLPGCPVGKQPVADASPRGKRPALRVIATGEEITRGSVRLTRSSDGSYAVQFSLSGAAAKRWCRFASNAHGRNTATVFDGRVVMESGVSPTCSAATEIAGLVSRSEALSIFGPLAFASYSPTGTPLRLWTGPGQPRAQGPPDLGSVENACPDRHLPARCYGPEDIRLAYEIQPLLRRGINGAGRTVVVSLPLGRTGERTSPVNAVIADLRAYDRLYGLPDPRVLVVDPLGLSLDLSGRYEATTDLEMAHAVAPAASIVLVVSGDGSVGQPPGSVRATVLRGIRDTADSLAYAVDHNLGDIITQSFGFDEQCVPDALRARLHQIYQTATQRGITLIASSGDEGAAGLSCGLFQSERRDVVLPAADPLVTAVGGTRLELDTTGKYLRETAWGYTGPTPTTVALSRLAGSASGGGVSSVYARPGYQDRVSEIGDHRGIPDVSFAADPFWSPGIVVRQKSKVYLVPNGGTSMGAPAWAGIVALADQYAHRRLGAINPALYRIGRGSNYARAFHDVLTGNNTVRLYSRTRKLLAAVHGFEARPGWDAVTGWGSPRVDALVPLLAQEPAADRKGEG